MSKTKPVTFRADLKLLGEFERVCEEHYLRKSSIFKKAMKEAIKEYDEKKKQEESSD